MSKAKSSAKSVMATDAKDVARNTDIELKRLWDRVNELSTALNNVNQGMRDNEDKGSFRFVESGNDRQIEARFKDGWARLATSFTLVTKKD